MTKTLLHIDSSARFSESASRILSAQVVAHLAPAHIIRRDLAQEALPQITENWIGANFTPADLRTDQQSATLAQSDALVDELIAADTIVIGLPVYNFSAPASLKLWIDLVARVGRTFHYTENGPQGLLTGKRVIVAFASGGVPLGAPVDFASTYLRQVLNFVGITDIDFVAAEGTAADAAAAVDRARAEIAKLAA